MTYFLAQLFSRVVFNWGAASISKLGDHLEIWVHFAFALWTLLVLPVLLGAAGSVRGVSTAKTLAISIPGCLIGSFTAVQLFAFLLIASDAGPALFASGLLLGFGALALLIGVPGAFLLQLAGVAMGRVLGPKPAAPAASAE